MISDHFSLELMPPVSLFSAPFPIRIQDNCPFWEQLHLYLVFGCLLLSFLGTAPPVPGIWVSNNKLYMKRTL
jgi:hypothetical protein